MGEDACRESVVQDRPHRPGNVARSFDRHARELRQAGRRQPGLPRAPADVGAADGPARTAGAGLRLLDLGCGTGASTAALLDAAPRPRSSRWTPRPRCWPRPGARCGRSGCGSCTATPRTWPGRLRGPFDGILAAYLVRNLAEPDAALRQFHDLLRPGAPLAVHEYSVRDSARSRAVWTAVCWSVIIPMGLVRTGSSDLYRYLWRSVLRFDGVQALSRAAARGRVRRRPGADRARLAAAHRAHLPRPAPARAGSGCPARPRCADVARGPPDRHRPGRDPADGHGPAEAGPAA